jgi:hypothetical protein
MDHFINASILLDGGRLQKYLLTLSETSFGTLTIINMATMQKILGYFKRLSDCGNLY